MVGWPTPEDSRGWVCGEPPLEMGGMLVLNEIAEWTEDTANDKEKGEGTR